MTQDKIKEILDRLNDDSYALENSYYRLFKEDRDKLLDYITNLQEENERLAKLKERYQLEKEVYKSRNEKAIEYMSETKLIYDDDDCCMLNETWYGKELLNILNGGENND